MRLTKATSLFAAASVVLAALVTIVSPILDLDCGADPGHFVTNVAEASFTSVGVSSDVLSDGCDRSATPVQTDGYGFQDGAAVHVHGMHAHALTATSAATIEFGTPFRLSFPLEPRLSDVTVQPPAEPPRIAA